MVTKTDTCSYSTFKIYPGIGRRFVSKNGTLSYFISNKARCMFHQGIRPVYLAWTMTWRGKHKKIITDQGQKRQGRKAQKVRKAVVGMSLDEKAKFAKTATAAVKNAPKQKVQKGGKR